MNSQLGKLCWMQLSIWCAVQAGDPQEVRTAEKHQVQSTCFWEEGVDKRKGEKTHIQTQKCKSKMDLISKFSFLFTMSSCVWLLCVCVISFFSQSKHQNPLQQSSRQNPYFIRYGVYSYQAKIISCNCGFNYCTVVPDLHPVIHVREGASSSVFVCTHRVYTTRQEMWSR